MNKVELFSEIDNIFDEIVQIRRKIHEYPELSFNEYKTTELIEKYLNSIGVKNFRLAETGVVALLGNSRSGKCIAFRADIDALPIEEKTDLPYSSKNRGVMHACGHDIHTAILLGAARVLRKFEDKLPIGIKLIFQPAEEKLPGGAKKLIELGVLKDPDVLAVFGEHTDPENETGIVSIASGTIMASADELYWTVKGKSSHAAQPHLGSDPIRASLYLCNTLYDLPNKIKDPLEPLLLAITSINGGFATNIYPDEVKIMGTLRTFNETTRNNVLKKIEKISQSVSNIFDVSVEFFPIIGYPPLINDVTLVEVVKQIGNEILGENNVLKFAPKMWAEDFAYYSQKVPSVFWFLGVKPKGYVGEVYGLHSSKYNPDESAIKYGIAMFVKIGLTFRNY
jgi:amidohydrolase